MPDAAADVLHAERVTKRFGALTAVNDVTWRLRENEIAGIIGSNGAGKTTFFNLLTGYYAPDEGVIRFRGRDISDLSAEQRVGLGLMRTFQLTSTFDNLTVVDNLVLAWYRANRRATLWQLLVHRRDRYRREPAILEALDTFELTHLADRLVSHLGLGEKRRVEIAMAVVTEPGVLLLDEPLAGLSESEIRGVLAVLRKRIGRQTILIVEHKIAHVEDFLQRLTVMHEGRVIADGSYDECLRHPEVRRSYWQIADDTAEPA